jgi:HAD superfamily hydrolase (TIGR01509 family)
MKTSPLRAIFFDAGNTLVFPRVEELAGDLTAQGYPATVEDFYAAERRGKHKLDEWLWPKIRSGELPRLVDHVYWAEYLRALMEGIHAPETERERLTRRLVERFTEIQFWSRVFPDTAPYLEALRSRGHYLGVISNSIGTMEEQLRRVDLARHFHTVLDSAIVGVEKPDPRIFRLALARAGVEASEAVFVGDIHATDVGGARSAGLLGVLIDRVGAYTNPDCPRITSLAELEHVLNRVSPPST